MRLRMKTNVFYKKKIMAAARFLMKCISEKNFGKIGFILKALHHNFTPTFAKISGQFINERDKKQAEITLMKSHITQHRKNLRSFCRQQSEIQSKITMYVGKQIFFVLQNTIYMFYNNLRKQNIQQLSTKNKKLLGFSKNVPTSSTEDSYNIPIINLSTYDIDTDPLKFGLHHSFIDKNKYIRRNLAVEMESLAEKLD